MMRFFIHTPTAMLGMLMGDDRGFSEDPDDEYRMVLFWDTATGQVSFTVAASHTSPQYFSDYMKARFGRRDLPSRMLKADDIELNARSSDTLGGNNVLNTRGSSSAGLKLGLHGVNSSFPLFAVDNDISISTNRSSVSVSRRGDAYPDMEVVQYPRNGGPKVIARDRMDNEHGLDSAPLKIPFPPINTSNINRSWNDGRCAGGCR
ncbi:hypothetical protein [Streptomyces sp. UNOC14_S4]|uniref:hypothetical protein n=1 Tax=Streptomyces sp. UNOC14_S4 TaxID=2872340 RepID=UPI001E4D2381|nr:hypothetical protein [Streptomyces sp. UNOC14_S4]MCC3769664.1 hypothetical protein [Streptomyces sp. UNOC14_S4]